MFEALCALTRPCRREAPGLQPQWADRRSRQPGWDAGSGAALPATQQATPAAAAACPLSQGNHGNQSTTMGSSVWPVTQSSCVLAKFAINYAVCVCLQEVFAGNNRLELLEAEQLSCLSAVTLLELRDNKIRNLPEEIALLLTLTRLDLTNNDIST